MARTYIEHSPPGSVARRLRDVRRMKVYLADAEAKGRIVDVPCPLKQFPSHQWRWALRHHARPVEGMMAKVDINHRSKIIAHNPEKDRRARREAKHPSPGRSAYRATRATLRADRLRRRATRSGAEA